MDTPRGGLTCACVALLAVAQLGCKARQPAVTSAPVAVAPTPASPQVQVQVQVQVGDGCGSELGSPDRRLTRFELAYAIEDVFALDASALHELPRPLVGIGDVPDILVGRLLDRSDAFLIPYRAKIAVLAETIATKLAPACDGGLRCVVDRLREPAARLWRTSSAEVGQEVEAAARAVVAQGGRQMFSAAVKRLLDDERFYILRNEPARQEAGPAFARRRLASRLALVLWSSVPDSELLRRAEAGELDAPARISAQAQRMMADPRFRRFAREFVRQWLRLDRAPAFRPSLDERKLVQDPKRLAAALDEAAGLLQHQLDGSAPVGALLSGERNLLTSTALLGAISTEIRGGGDESWLGRGVLVQSALLCRTFPLAAVYPWKMWKDHPLLDPHVAATTKRPGERVLLAMRTKDTPCRACHRQLETIGAALWRFDGLGRPNRSANPAASIAGRQVDGPEQLARWILDTGRFEPCLAQKLLTYVLGRAVLPAKRAPDRCLVHGVAAKPTFADWLASGLESLAVQGATVVRDKPTPAPTSNDYVDPLSPAAATAADCARFDPGVFLVESCGTSACHGAGSTVAAFALPDAVLAATALRNAEPSPDGYCADHAGLIDPRQPSDSLVIQKLTAGGKACGGPMPITGGPRTLNPTEHACFVRWVEAVARPGT
jgi:hypothetical protein